MQDMSAAETAWALPTFTVCNSLAKALVSFSERGAGGAIALPPALAKNPRAFLHAMHLWKVTDVHLAGVSLSEMKKVCTASQPVFFLLLLP